MYIQNINVGTKAAVFSGHNKEIDKKGEIQQKFYYLYDSKKYKCEVELYNIFVDDNGNMDILEEAGEPAFHCNVPPEGISIGVPKNSLNSNFSDDRKRIYKLSAVNSSDETRGTRDEKGQIYAFDKEGVNLIWSNDDLGFAYRFKLTEIDAKGNPIQGKKPLYAFDNGDVIGIEKRKKEAERFNVVLSNSAVISKNGPMQLIMPDSYYPFYKKIQKDPQKPETAEYIDTFTDKDVKSLPTKDLQAEAIAHKNKVLESVRTHANKLGGRFDGIIKQLPKIKEEGISRIVGTPFTKDTVSSHMYWTENAYQISPSIGDEKDFRRLQQELFKNGINWIADAALVNEGLNGFHVSSLIQHNNENEKESYLKGMFRGSGKKKLGILPDKSNNPNDHTAEHTKLKIINPKFIIENGKIKDNKENYISYYPTYVQLYDDRLASKRQVDSHLVSEMKTYENTNVLVDKNGKVIINKDENVRDEDCEVKIYDITTHDDAVYPFAFEVDPDDLTRNLKMALETQSIDNSKAIPYELIPQVTDFGNFQIVNKSSAGGFDTWDGNVDITKLNFYLNTLDYDRNKNLSSEQIENMERGTLLVKDYALKSGIYWTKTANDAQIEYITEEFKKKFDYEIDKEGYVNVKERTADDYYNILQTGAGKVFPESVIDIDKETIENVLNDKYSLKKLSDERKKYNDEIEDEIEKDKIEKEEKRKKEKAEEKKLNNKPENGKEVNGKEKEKERKKDYDKEQKLTDKNFIEYIKKEAMNTPLETLNLNSNLLSILTSPYIVNRPIHEKYLGLTNFELSILQKPDEKYAATLNQMQEIYEKLAPIISTAANEAAYITSDIEDSWDSKGISDDEGKITDYGRYVVSEIAPDLTKFYIIKALEKSLGIPKSVEIDENGQFGYCNNETDITDFTIQALGLKYQSEIGMTEYENREEKEAKILLKAIKEGLKKIDKENEKNKPKLNAIREEISKNDAAIAATKDKNVLEELKQKQKELEEEKKGILEDCVHEAVNEGIKNRLKGRTEEDYKIADMIMDRTESGLGWRIDAAKDISCMDAVRSSDEKMEKAWDDTIKFWKLFNQSVLEENPHAYTTAEITDLPLFFEKYDKDGKYVTDSDAERKFLEQTGITSVADYNYKFAMLPSLVTKYSPQLGLIADTDSGWAGWMSQGEQINKMVSNLTIGWDKDGQPNNPGFLFQSPADGITNSYSFVGNHDKPRILHGLALNMNLFNGRFEERHDEWGDKKRLNEERRRIAYFVVNPDKVSYSDKDKVDMKEVNKTNFDNLNPKAIAMGERIDIAIDRIQNINEEEKKQLKIAVSNLAQGKYKGEEFLAEAFGTRPFEIAIRSVLNEANYLNKQNPNQYKVSFDKEKQEDIQAALLKDRKSVV